MKAIGYVRVSTSQQAEDGVSLDAQEAKVRAYCSLYGIELAGLVSDGALSGKDLDRPGLQDALSRLDAGEATAIVIDKLDRLTRSVRDLDALLSRYFRDRFNLVSVSEQIDTSTPSGRLVLNVLVSVAQWEREAIADRTKTALQHKRRSGERTGSVPWGYRLADDGVRLVEDAREQEMVRSVLRDRAKGLSLLKIAARLEARGHRNRAGRPFNHNTIAQIVRGATDRANIPLRARAA